MKKLNKIIGIAGATIAFYIGSGFATGQEVLQYSAAYGMGCLWVILLAIGLFVVTNLSFIRAGENGALTVPGGIYRYYCGKAIGWFYDVFATLFIFLSFVVMCGGAGASLEQQFGLPNWIGICVIALLTIVTVLGGLSGLVDVLGKLGPVIIVCIALLGIITTIRDFDMIKTGVELIETEQVEVIRVGNSPVSSAASYAGFVLLWFCTFMAELGDKEDAKQVRIGMYIGSATIAFTMLVFSLGLIANIEEVAPAAIPSALLMGKIAPALAPIFIAIVFCGIYTTSVPLLWTVVRLCSKEGTPRYRIMTVVLSLAGAGIAMFLPYQKLVNIVYGINGYVGIAFLIFLVARVIRDKKAAGKA